MRGQTETHGNVVSYNKKKYKLEREQSMGQWFELAKSLLCPYPQKTFIRPGCVVFLNDFVYLITLQVVDLLVLKQFTHIF